MVVALSSVDRGWESWLRRGSCISSWLRSTFFIWGGLQQRLSWGGFQTGRNSFVSGGSTIWWLRVDLVLTHCLWCQVVPVLNWFLAWIPLSGFLQSMRFSEVDIARATESPLCRELRMRMRRWRVFLSWGLTGLWMSTAWGFQGGVNGPSQTIWKEFCGFLLSSPQSFATTSMCRIALCEKREEYLRLAQRWDDLGLLRLHEAEEDVGYCKIFNTWKNEGQDRQIGDRRSVNAQERSISGPSSQLPCGSSLLNLSCRRGGCLRGSVTDRRDFYHQVKVSRSRSSTNKTPFGFSREELVGLAALEEYDEAEKVGAFDRRVHGDRYGKNPVTKQTDAPLHPSFGALYQGDHLGVEFALAGHESLLRREGLLVEDERLQTRRAPPLGATWQGLIIDDFFVISSQPVKVPAEKSSAFLHLAQARAAYERHSLPGSPEKDVVASRTFKAAGAECDSSPDLSSVGICLVGAPLQKRLGLGLLSLRLASLEAISFRLASRVSGRVSVLLYRRCINSVVEVRRRRWGCFDAFVKKGVTGAHFAIGACPYCSFRCGLPLLLTCFCNWLVDWEGRYSWG